MTYGFAGKGLVMHKTIKALARGFKEFEKTIGYRFKLKRNLVLAFTHSSYANESKSKEIRSNERLEFLGDAVLNLVISEYIYNSCPEMTEGEMTKSRAVIVCESSLAKCANNINIGKFLLLGKGEELTGGRTRISILSDSFEAVIGAIFIDGGIKPAKNFILKQMQQIIHGSVHGTLFMDYKTELQELVQKNGEKKIVYEKIEESGPDHNKVFVLQVKVDGNVLGVGTGKTKKEAEQNAAKIALEKIIKKG